jgi:ketosteroid isomerase-like protein
VTRAVIEQLVALAGRGFEGDADEALEAFTDDAELQEQPGEPLLRGRADLEGFFLDYGGRRARFALRELVVEGDRAAVAYDLWFRSDSTAYGQHGMALLRLDGERIAAWRGVWVQIAGHDLSPWDFD